MNSNLSTVAAETFVAHASVQHQAEDCEEEDLVLYPPDRSEIADSPMDELARRDRIRLWFAYYTDSRHLFMYAAATMIYGALFFLWLFAQQA